MIRQSSSSILGSSRTVNFLCRWGMPCGLQRSVCLVVLCLEGVPVSVQIKFLLWRCGHNWFWISCDEHWDPQYGCYAVTILPVSCLKMLWYQAAYFQLLVRNSRSFYLSWEMDAHRHKVLLRGQKGLGKKRRAGWRRWLTWNQCLFCWWF